MMRLKLLPSPILLFLTLVMKDVDELEDVVEGIDITSIVLIVRKICTLKISVSSYMTFQQNC